MGILKKLLIIFCAVLMAAAIPFTVYAEPDDEIIVEENTEEYVEPETQAEPEPDPEPVTEEISQIPTEAVQPETEPVTEKEWYDYIEELTLPDFDKEETEPETEAIQTETQAEEPVTEPETEPVTDSPWYAEYIEKFTQPTKRDLSELPTLMDSTEPAEKLPSDFGADSENGGVSYVGGIVCWSCVGVALIMVLGFVISSTGRTRSGTGRYDSGNKLGGSNYR